MRLPGRYDGVARPIVTYGSNPVLHRPCAPVTTFDEGLRRLVLDMFASMTAADGVGCAARLREFAPDVVILDTDLLWGGADGVLARLRVGGDPCTPVVLLTGRSAAPPRYGSPAAAPVVSVIEEPVEMGALSRAVRFAAGAGAAAGPEA